MKGPSWTKYVIGVFLLLVFGKYYWGSSSDTTGQDGVNPKSLVGSDGTTFQGVHNCTVDSTLDCFNNAKGIQQDDPILVQLIRTKYIIPPSKKRINLPPFNTANYFDRPSEIVSRVQDILTTLSPGFFIECGALDGLMASNTIWLERKFGWTGLLIEASRKDFVYLVKLRRRAWVTNFCLSHLPYPNKVNFYLAPKDGLPGVGGLIPREKYNTVPVETQCMPLYTLLLALNRTTIDYFSLDVEGSEPDILKTIPFDKIIFKVFSLENGNGGGAPVLAKFLTKKGYIFYRYGPDDKRKWDSIFLHHSIHKLTNQSDQHPVAASM